MGAVFTGQLSVGWSNDYIDADRDRASLRSDKPLATDAIAPSTVGIAAALAVLCTMALSALLGWPSGAVALLTVLTAWVYNLGLKGTVLSWLPYAVAFGLSPAIATLAASPPRWPAAWVLSVGVLLGIAAHLGNVLPDLGDDAATGIRGLAHRIGARATALTAAGLLLAASVVILVGPYGQAGPWRWAGLLAAVLMAGAATRFAFRDPSSRRFFFAIIVIAGLDLASFGFSGIRL
jgi:4-hydroxybenzoate polyprenyltransferase